MPDILVEVYQSPGVTVEVIPPQPVEVVIEVGQGPAGPPGALGSDAHYIHEQMSASASWTISHGLGKVPVIMVIDSAGSEVEGRTSVVSLNVLQVDFSAPFSGTAYCN